MRVLHVLGALSLLLIFGVSCGSNESEQSKTGQQAAAPAQQAPSGVNQDKSGNPAQPGQQMAQGLQQMAQGFQQLATSGGETVKPVHFRELKTVFPDYSGWQRGDSSGQIMNLPVPYSQAETSYTKGDARIKANLVDSTMSQMLLAPFTMLVSAGFEKETDTGYEKGGQYNGNPMWEKWEGKSQKGELQVLVNKRFLLSLKGNSLDDMKTLKELLEKFDLEKLASLK